MEYRCARPVASVRLQVSGCKGGVGNSGKARRRWGRASSHFPPSEWPLWGRTLCQTTGSGDFFRQFSRL